MANHIEWAFAGSEPPYTNLPELLSPDLLEEISPDGNDARHWGLSTEGIMLYGTLGELRTWLEAALKDLEEPLRKQANREIKARRREQGLGKCKHDFLLMEDGYDRTWARTEMDHENKVLTATSDGWGDFSDEGSGEYLQCVNCGHTKLVPADWQVDYQ